MKLYISGGTHITRKSTIEGRIDEITSKLGEVDAIFVERREGIGVSRKDRVLNWLATPFMFLAMRLYFMLGIFEKLGRGDGSVTQGLMDRHDVSEDMVYRVHKPPHLIVKKNRKWWAHIHWTQTGFYFVLAGFLTETFSISPMVLSGIVVYIFIAVGAFFLILYIHFTMMERNLHMLKQVDEHREANEIESACLIVGKRHESGTKDLCAIFDNIELVE